MWADETPLHIGVLRLKVSYLQHGDTVWDHRLGSMALCAMLLFYINALKHFNVLIYIYIYVCIFLCLPIAVDVSTELLLVSTKLAIFL